MHNYTEPIFKVLKLLKLEDSYKCQLLKFYYKLVTGKLPSYFNIFSVLPVTGIHIYNTRGNYFVNRVSHSFDKM